MPRFPCKLCKGCHHTHLFSGIWEVQRIWSQPQGSSSIDSPMSSQQPLSPTSTSPIANKTSNSDNNIKGKKGKLKFSCKLWSQNHITHIFPHIEESYQSLEDSVISQQQPPSSSQETCSKQSLIEEVFELEKSSTSPTLSLESDENTTHVLIVGSIFFCQGVISLMEPPISPEIISFDWNSLLEHPLPSYVPFQIIVEVLSSMIYQTIIDEGPYISILSSMACQAIDSPNLETTLSHLLAFNRSTSEPFGLLPQLPIMLGRKIVCIDVMIVQVPLDFKFLLDHNDIYFQKVTVFSSDVLSL